MILFTSIVGWILYAKHDRGYQWVEHQETTPFAVSMSIGNLGRDPKKYESADVYVLIALNTIVIVIIFILNILYKQVQIRIVKKVDEINISPGDFTVMVSNIPKDKTRDELKDWLIKHEEGTICDINLCYDIKEPIEKLEKVNKLK